MNNSELEKVLKEKGMDACIINTGEKELFSFRKENREQQPEAVNSVTKSILSLVTAKALEENYFELGTEITEVLKVDASFDGKTVEDLLTMSTGLTEKNWQEAITAEGWLESLCRSKIRSSDKTFHYNNADSYLLSAVLAERIQSNWLEYAVEKIFSPLKIEQWEWKLSPDGLPIGGYGLKMTAEDLMKIGILVLNKGQWEGEELLTSSSIKKMTAPVVDHAVRNQHYGQHWWITPDKPQIVYGAGKRGKFLFLIPEKNVAAVFLGELPGEDLLPFQWFVKYASSSLQNT
ncbi:serine hydrolase domain-containing protein [Alkalicoccus halolimnae]|uniref:Serine hydrolase n=1 Tax=Alkalicoccus halolimnae TaxID=1667239 RepID=A0A5C7FLI4_9BACI|nr:serine hydrolase [Alkalicoccus halolimnae]TXF87204.1 serine hydrolase [Alkalicoccus halolimnae]